MGSFDSVCSFSKLPLHSGNRMVVQFVRLGDVLCGEPTECFLPFGFPVRGEYNDYGALENVDRDYALEFLGRYVERELGFEGCRLMERTGVKESDPLVDRFMTNVFHGDQPIGEVKFSESDWQPGRMKVEDDESSDRICAVMLHEDIYRHVVDLGMRNLNDLENYFCGRNEMNRGNVDAFFDAYREHAVKGDCWRNPFKREDPNYFYYHMFLEHTSDCYAGDEHMEYVIKLINGSLGEIEMNWDSPIVQAQIESRAFRSGRKMLNLELVPHFSYAGNQYYEDRDIKNFRAFNKAVGSMITKLRKRE